MPYTLTTITNFINSPPGQLGAGGVLFGTVWGFFRGAESVISEETKIEIWLWLADREPLSPTFKNWPNTFAKIFDRVFGQKSWSWTCFWRSAVASLVVAVPLLIVSFPQVLTTPILLWAFLSFLLYSNVLPDYLSLIETRLVLAQMRRHTSVLWWSVLLLSDLIITGYIAMFGISIASDLGELKLTNSPVPWTYYFKILPNALWPQLSRISTINQHSYWFVLYPAFFTSIWLWLYAGSGFLLKAMFRFDKYVRWFSRFFDTEHQPLSSMGFVAGALLAGVYWAAVIVSRTV